MKRKQLPPYSASLKELKDLLAIFEESTIGELELEREGWKIRLKKSSGEAVVTHHHNTVAVPGPAASLQPPSTPLGTSGSPAGGEGERRPDPPAATAGLPITSPMVGTFYRSSDPDSAPYVQVGDVVSEGQVLCIIEAMKLMNEIKAEFRCKILQMGVENGQTIEFGQSLFLVEKIS